MLRQGFRILRVKKILLRRSDRERTTAVGSTNPRQPPILSGEADPRGHTSHRKISGQGNRVALYGNSEIDFCGTKSNETQKKLLAAPEETTEAYVSP